MPAESRYAPVARMFAALGFMHLWVVVCECGLLLQWQSQVGLSHVALQHGSLIDFGKDVYGMTAGPLYEEVTFRLVPLWLAMRWRPQRLFGEFSDQTMARWTAIITWLTVALTCGLLFGAMHEHTHNLLLLGPVGAALGWLFVRNAQRGSLFTAYVTCVVAHSGYNFLESIKTYFAA